MKNMIIILLVCIIIWIIYEFNNLISLKKKVERAESVVDVFLKKRFDLIPNLVETVKGYVQYEQDTLQNIIVMRNNYMNTHSIEDGKKLTEDYKKVLAIAEALPTLKASENFLNLQKELSKVESEIQAARRIYINEITNFNTKIETIPYNLFAKILGYKIVEYPELIYDEVKINFD